jgi:hypothetical protein
LLSSSQETVVEQRSGLGAFLSSSVSSSVAPSSSSSASSSSAQGTQSQLILFNRNIWLFSSAIELINDAVLALCALQGFVVENTEYPLPNLLALLKWPFLGR